jgi:hypothetical protein
MWPLFALILEMHPGDQSVGHLCNLVALSSYLSLAISGLHFAKCFNSCRAEREVMSGCSEDVDTLIHSGLVSQILLATQARIQPHKLHWIPFA